MATLTIRNVKPETVQSLKKLAASNQRSMEQEVRNLLEGHVGDRLSAIEQIEAGWKDLKRRPTAEEIDSWKRMGRP
jgi:plasmid stability protein